MKKDQKIKLVFALLLLQFSFAGVHKWKNWDISVWGSGGPDGCETSQRKITLGV